MSGDVPAVDVAETQLETAVEAVVEADEGSDRTLVRDALERCTEGGVVTWSAVDDALAAATRAASTASEYTSMAAFELAKLRDETDHVADLPTVEARLDDFEHELAVLRERASELSERVEALPDRVEDADSLYPVAVEVRDVSDEAESVEDTAIALFEAIDECSDELDDPESWVRDVRRDLVAVGDTLDAVENVADSLGSARGDQSDDWTADVDPAVAWFDATLRAGVVGLLVADARFELADLRTWADREDADWYPDDADDQAASVRTRQEALAARLDDLARPAWRERFDERLEAFEGDVAETDPPVDWRELQATLARYRPDDARA